VTYSTMTWLFGPEAQPFTLFEINALLVLHLATFNHLRPFREFGSPRRAGSAIFSIAPLITSFITPPIQNISIIILAMVYRCGIGPSARF